MADKKISALDAGATPLAGTETLPIVQSGVTKKISVDNLTAGKTVKTGNLFAGACFGSAFFVGREIAQAEYRVIQAYYDGKRANMPWYGAFERRAWNVKSILDFVLPIVAITIVLYLSTLYS
jgi:hypothetical protein